MESEKAVSAPVPGEGHPSGVTPTASTVGIAREGGATIVRLTAPEAHLTAGRVFSELTHLAIAARGRLVICMDKAAESTKEWLGAISDLARRCDVLGGRLVVCASAEPTEENVEATASTRRGRVPVDRGSFSPYPNEPPASPEIEGT